MFTRLTQSLTKGGQAVSLKQLYSAEHDVRKVRLRLELHCDSYEHQSWGHIQLWDGGQWQTVWHLSGHEMVTRKQIAYDPNWENPRLYEQDVEMLLKQARLVMTGETLQ